MISVKVGKATLAQDAARVLLVDVCGDETTALLGRPFDAMQPAEYTAVTADLIREFKPDMVVAPLFGKTYDILDLGMRLQEAGYSGALRAITANLPDPSMIEKEVRSQVRGIDFSVHQNGMKAAS